MRSQEHEKVDLPKTQIMNEMNMKKMQDTVFLIVIFIQYVSHLSTSSGRLASQRVVVRSHISKTYHRPKKITLYIENL